MSEEVVLKPSTVRKLVRVRNLKASLKRDEEEMRTTQSDVISDMKDAGASKIAVPLGTADDGGLEVLPVTLVEPTGIVFDHEGLLAELTDEQIAACTRTVIDNALLEACVASGVIPIDVVDRHSEEIPKSPYLLFGKTKSVGRKKKARKR